MSVDKKILEIMQVVKTLSKDGKISFGNTKYNFISDEEVVAKLRQEMIDRGLIMYPKLSESEIVESGNKFLTKVTQTFVIQDTEDGSTIEICTCGQGMDSADKGSGKSNTSARKYALLQTFMLTGDDPDIIPSDSYHSASIMPGSNHPTTTPVPPAPEGQHVIGFGKHKGKILEELIKTDDGKNWARWYADKGTDESFKAIVVGLLEG